MSKTFKASCFMMLGGICLIWLISLLQGLNQRPMIAMSATEEALANLSHIQTKEAIDQGKTTLLASIPTSSASMHLRTPPAVRAWKNAVIHSLCLNMQESYNAPQARLFQSTVRDTLSGAGIQVVNSQPCEGTLVINVSDQSLSALYNGGLTCYSGEEIKGEVTLKSPGYPNLSFPISYLRKPPNQVYDQFCSRSPELDSEQRYKEVIDGLANIWGTSVLDYIFITKGDGDNEVNALLGWLTDDATQTKFRSDIILSSIRCIERLDCVRPDEAVKLLRTAKASTQDMATLTAETRSSLIRISLSNGDSPSRVAATEVLGILADRESVRALTLICQGDSGVDVHVHESACRGLNNIK